ncbi:Periaxin [Formica fusca]
MEDATAAAQDTCFGAGSVAGAVIGTFLTTILLLAVAALLYRQWRRHKGKHLVLVTDPEIVEDAYAFDNPCFKDATPTTVGRVTERPSSTVLGDTPAKDSTRWTTPWTSLGLGSAIRNEKRRTLDDSCVGPKATRVSVVGLRSRDFTGLGFNVCGNMREGIFVKDLLHRGPASESGRIHPGDRISSVKISFRNMVYEDALTILSYASPYDVELEVESGGNGSKPTTLLKKSVGPSPTRICHPLYRSQSIPELTQAHKSVAKRLFIADPNESVGSNQSTMNSTLKSSKSTPGGGQSLERRHDETTKNNHHKFGIKVLPALDGTVHRIENQNEHNTNLERRHSRKIDAEKLLASSNRQSATSSDEPLNVTDERKLCNESFQQRVDQPDGVVSARITTNLSDNKAGRKSADAGGGLNIPSEVPTEVHNAAMAARRNRKSSSEPLKISSSSPDSDGAKSPQKNKRKAPAPPRNNISEMPPLAKKDAIDTIDSIADYTESLCDYVNKARENTDARRHRLESQSVVNRRNSESDTDNEMQNSFTTIELNPADITIHRTPVPEANDDDEDEDYRKAASLGDLSKYESRTAATLERAQSLDMSADTSTKKRKAPLPPEDINESTEDLTKLDQIDSFDRRKLKKSNEWGTLEDVIWSEAAAETDEKARGKTSTRKKSNGTLERSKSAVEIKLKEEVTETTAIDDVSEKKKPDNNDHDITSIELYNLPLSKRLTQEFIHAERMFNPDEDNSLARIVNDGRVVKSPTPKEVELDFQLADEKRFSKENQSEEDLSENDTDNSVLEKSEDFSRALRYFKLHANVSPAESTTKTVNLVQLNEQKEEKASLNDASLYAGKQAVVEEPLSKITIDRGCHGCENRHCQHSANCERGKYADRPHRVTVRSFSDDNKIKENVEKEVERACTPTHLRIHASKSEPARHNKSQDPREETNTEGKNGTFSTFQAHRTKFEQRGDKCSPTDSSFIDTHFARRVINVSGRDGDDGEEEEEDEYDFGSGVTAHSKSPSSPKEDRHNISSVSVSSGENSEDSGLVRESMDYNNPQDSENRPPLPDTPMPLNAAHKMTYITEIKVSPNRESVREIDSENEDGVITTGTNGESRKSLTQHEIKVTSNGKPTSGKKPPVPPRRSDITRSPKEDRTDKQVVYVSEYKSATGKRGQILDPSHQSEIKQSEGKKFEHWIFMSDKEQNRWNPASSQPQSVTNIMLSSRDDAN